MGLEGGHILKKNIFYRKQKSTSNCKTNLKNFKNETWAGDLSWDVF
jgi:hypothetical protein